MEPNIRPLPELLQVFLDNQDLFVSGFCRWTSSLKRNEKITEEEEEFVDSLVQKETENLNKNPFSFIWESGNIQPRLDWLKEKLK